MIITLFNVFEILMDNSWFAFRPTASTKYCCIVQTVWITLGLLTCARRYRPNVAQRGTKVYAVAYVFCAKICITSVARRLRYVCVCT